MSALLQAPDFWSRTGARVSHPAISDRDLAAIRELAGTAQDPVVRIRARKILADVAGHTRYSQQVPEGQVLEAVEAGFWYLETHLDDKTVAQFHPESGFSHVTVSPRSGDGAVWLLIEAAGGSSYAGGLNIRYQPTSKTVDKVEHWGGVRQAPVAAGP